MLGLPYQHAPVMAREVLDYLNPTPGKVYVDCTLGGGGHALALLSSPLSSPPSAENSFPSPSKMERGAALCKRVRNAGVRIIAFDQDSEAIAAAKQRLSAYDSIEHIQANFSNLKKHIHRKIDGVLFDLGVSSYQIDAPERGFSLRQDGPLDMRMGQKQELTAATIVNNFSTEELTRIFKEYGEERFAKRIGHAICAKRKTKRIETTFELKEIIEKAIPIWKKRESVTRIFQALRIAVNRELERLQSALADAIDLLSPGGRIVVISYHSLEDRIVKNAFRGYHNSGRLKILTKKPVTPAAEEIENNPRAGSAKLRAGEKI